MDNDHAIKNNVWIEIKVAKEGIADSECLHKYIDAHGIIVMWYF